MAPARRPSRRARAGWRRCASSAGRPPPRRRRLRAGPATRTNRRRATGGRSRRGSDRPSPSRRGCRAAPARRSARSPPLDLALAVDAECRPRTSLETLLGDLAAAARAEAERAVVDSLQRVLDLLEHLLGVLLERVVDLAVERPGCGLCQVIVRPTHDLLGLVLERPGSLLVQVLDRVAHALPLPNQRFTEPVGVDGHARPLPAASASNRSAPSAEMPVSATTLSREPWPDTSSTLRAGTRSVSASSRSTASFARPSSGGSATRTFHAPPWRPAIPGRRAPGETRSLTCVARPLMRGSVPPTPP